MKNINVLIVDDIGVVGDCVKKRLAKQDSYFVSQDFRVNPYFYKVVSLDPQLNAKEIERVIKERKINYLLLDRGFYAIIDPSSDSSTCFDKSYLFRKINNKGINIEDILRQMDISAFRDIKGVIIYSYDDDLLEEEADLVNQFSSIFPPSCAGNIEILLTYKEIYLPSGLNLYISEPINDEIEKIGKRSDFILYGLQIGEILYHRIMVSLRIQKNNKMLIKSLQTQRNLLLIFAVFTGLNLGSNAIFYLISQQTGSNLVLILTLSIVFSLLLPLIILKLKPEWMISFEDK